MGRGTIFNSDTVVGIHVLKDQMLEETGWEEPPVPHPFGLDLACLFGVSRVFRKNWNMVFPTFRAKPYVYHPRGITGRIIWAEGVKNDPIIVVSPITMGWSADIYHGETVRRMYKLLNLDPKTYMQRVVSICTYRGKTISRVEP